LGQLLPTVLAQLTTAVAPGSGQGQYLYLPPSQLKKLDAAFADSRGDGNGNGANDTALSFDVNVSLQGKAGNKHGDDSEEDDRNDGVSSTLKVRSADRTESDVRVTVSTSHTAGRTGTTVQGNTRVATPAGPALAVTAPATPAVASAAPAPAVRAEA